MVLYVAIENLEKDASIFFDYCATELMRINQK